MENNDKTLGKIVSEYDEVMKLNTKVQEQVEYVKRNLDYMSKEEAENHMAKIQKMIAERDALAKKYGYGESSNENNSNSSSSSKKGEFNIIDSFTAKLVAVILIIWLIAVFLDKM